MQRIKIEFAVPSTGYSFNILSAHQVNDQLVVVSTITTPHGAQGCSVCFISKEFTVNTNASQPLPVVHYLINNEQNSRPYISCFFKSIASTDVIQDILNQGTLVYEPRLDNLRALRLSDFDMAKQHNKPIQAFLFPTQLKPLTNYDYILNIFTVIAKDKIKLVFETITKSSIERSTRDIISTLSDKIELGECVMSLEKDMLMMKDDKLYFNAMVSDVKTPCSTSAVEFIIPVHKPKAVLHFLQMVDAALQSIRQKKSEYVVNYNHIQLSTQSILASFEDLILFKQYGYRYEESYYNNADIKCEMAETMEAFLNKAGTQHDPDSISNTILQLIMNESTLPCYSELQSAIAEFYSTLDSTQSSASAASAQKKSDKTNIITHQRLLLSSSSSPDKYEVLLQKVGIYSKQKYQLLSQKSECYDVLNIIEKANLFTENVSQNNCIYASIINGMPGNNKYNSYNTNNSFYIKKLYQILSGESAPQLCLLTPSINQRIITDILFYCRADSLVSLLSGLKPLTQNVANKIFSHLDVYLNLWDCMRRDHSTFQLFLNDSIPIANIITCESKMSKKQEWISKENVEALLADPTQVKHIIKGFNILCEHKLLDTERDNFLKNPCVATKTFDLLNSIGSGMLIPELIALTNSNPEVFYSATSVAEHCTYQRLVDLKDSESLIKTLANNTELRLIATKLCEKAREYRKHRHAQYDGRFDDDLELLLTVAGLRSDRGRHVSRYSMFVSQPSLTLNQCISNLNEKYKEENQPTAIMQI